MFYGQYVDGGGDGVDGILVRKSVVWWLMGVAVR
jgi:hypothetical protein